MRFMLILSVEVTFAAEYYLFNSIVGYQVSLKLKNSNLLCLVYLGESNSDIILFGDPRPLYHWILTTICLRTAHGDYGPTVRDMNKSHYSNMIEIVFLDFMVPIFG